MIRRYELPYPPSVNHYWRNVKGRTLISREGRAYRTRVASLLPSMIVALEGTLYVRILAHPPDRRKRDLDNILKSLLDSLQHARVFADDNQISKIEITRGCLWPGGLVKIELEPYNEDQS